MALFIQRMICFAARELAIFPEVSAEHWHPAADPLCSGVFLQKLQSQKGTEWREKDMPAGLLKVEMGERKAQCVRKNILVH